MLTLTHPRKTSAADTIKDVIVATDLVTRVDNTTLVDRQSGFFFFFFFFVPWKQIFLESNGQHA